MLCYVGGRKYVGDLCCLLLEQFYKLPLTHKSYVRNCLIIQ